MVPWISCSPPGHRLIESLQSPWVPQNSFPKLDGGVMGAEGRGLESKSLPRSHHGRHTRNPGLGLSAWQFDAGCGARTSVEDSRRPPGRGSKDCGEWEPPAARLGAQMAGRQGLRTEAACGLALSVVLPALHWSSKGQRRPLSPSLGRSLWLTPGKPPWKPDG